MNFNLVLFEGVPQRGQLAGAASGCYDTEYQQVKMSAGGGVVAEVLVLVLDRPACLSGG